jgi:multidrug resistance efflux pump
LVEDGSASEQDYDDARFSAQALAAAESTAAAQRQSRTLELEKSTLRAPYEAVVAERLVQTGAVGRTRHACSSIGDRHRAGRHTWASPLMWHGGWWPEMPTHWH